MMSYMRGRAARALATSEAAGRGEGPTRAVGRVDERAHLVHDIPEVPCQTLRFARPRRHRAGV